MDPAQSPATRFQKTFIKSTKRRTLCNLSLRDSAIQRCTLYFHRLRQRALYESENLFLLVRIVVVLDHQANPMRLTESNEELVKVHPPSVDFIPSGLFRVGRATDERGDRAEVYMDGDFAEIFVFECDGIEGHSNPYDGRCTTPE